jgi:hypothetical protein
MLDDAEQADSIVTVPVQAPVMDVYFPNTIRQGLLSFGNCLVLKFIAHHIKAGLFSQDQELARKAPDLEQAKALQPAPVILEAPGDFREKSPIDVSITAGETSDQLIIPVFELSAVVTLDLIVRRRGKHRGRAA